MVIVNQDLTPGENELDLGELMNQRLKNLDFWAYVVSQDLIISWIDLV